MQREDWDRRYQGTELLWTAEPNRFVAAEVAELPPGRALDLAAGEGRNAVWLAERGWRVTAVDFSSVALDKAQGLARARGVTADWVLADLREYRAELRAYDLVLVAYLQVSPPERARVLHNAVAALAPGGTLLVVGHDLTNLDGGIGGPRDPVLLYTPESIVAELDGLTVRRAGRVRRRVDTATASGEAVDTLVVATRD
ncbi:MAG TPA: class I SAM-dependent methyltransferase [Actinomycetota bacterium]|jgi:SAM-dependent methyltransferase|nr:class I SAM-dependent methyltransferase [Actinomycetota bacterium]